MNNIPDGNVTFLFTDIEGSTKHSQKFPETYPAALEKHHSIMKNAVVSNNGYVFRIAGDAFCCAFEKAEYAVRAAVDAQKDLASEKWVDAEIKVRMGIHSGTAEWNGDRYIGYITLARTARVMSAAYGEQIIISNNTYELTGESSAELNRNIISFRDLGERRLKDVIQPIRLFQIISSGLREDFPPLKTLDARPNNLPVQLTSFIGREEVMLRIKNLFRQTHLLTIVGTGGGGKTRLAMQMAADLIDDFSIGVYITEFAQVSDSYQVVQTIMNSIGLKEEPGNLVENTLTEYLKDKEILIILDNCEHLISECANISEMLISKCPKLKLISTSREALNCSGEQTYILPSLSVPLSSEEYTPEKIMLYDSVRLFIERAMSVNPNFRLNRNNAPALAEICSRLDGIPLAIELAAARIKVLSVEKIHERLGDRFNLLSAGKRTALPRQQTLRALIDWSYDLLSEKEKKLWSRLSVFNGGWDLESAEDICSDESIAKGEILDLMSQLAEKSIIIYDEENERYRILESIKQYGEEKLIESKETDTVFSRHLQYYTDLSVTAAPQLTGNEAILWLEKLETSHSNIQSAIEWSIEKGDKESGIRLAGVTGKFWDMRGHYSAGRYLLESTLNNVKGINKSVIGQALYWSGTLAVVLGDNDKAQNIFEEYLTLSREESDKNGIAKSLTGLGNVFNNRGNFEQARSLYEESLLIRRELGDKIYIAESLNGLGTISIKHGNSEQGQKYFEECLQIYRELGKKQGISPILCNLGVVAFQQDNFDLAQKYFEESLSLCIEMGDKNVTASSLTGLGTTAHGRGNYELAWKYYEESIVLLKEIGNKRGLAISISNLGFLSQINKNYEEAKKYFEEFLLLSRETGDKNGIAESLLRIGEMEFILGNHEIAKNLFKQCLELRIETSYNAGIAITLLNIAGVLCAEDRNSAALNILGAAEALFISTGKILNDTEQNLREQLVCELHEKFNEEEYMNYFEEGKNLSLEKAYQFAMNNEQ
jgi:predicted ATPase/class 3 adenylate cyclase/TolA-binding protein